MYTTPSLYCFDWSCASNPPHTSNPPPPQRDFILVWFFVSPLVSACHNRLVLFCFSRRSLCGPTRSPRVSWRNSGSRRRLLGQLNRGQLGEKKKRLRNARVIPPHRRRTGLHRGTNICPWSPLSLARSVRSCGDAARVVIYRRNDGEDEEESVFPPRPDWPVVRRWMDRAITIRRVSISPGAWRDKSRNPHCLPLQHVCKPVDSTPSTGSCSKVQYCKAPPTPNNSDPLVSTAHHNFPSDAHSHTQLYVCV